MITTLKLIEGSLRLLGVLSKGEGLPSDEANDALEALNQMLDSWSSENLLVYGKAIEEFSLVASQSSYTVGDGGNFNITYPLNIDAAFLRKSNVDYPVEIIDNKEYGEITNKSTQSNIAQKIYIDDNYPLKTIYVYPVPSEANSLLLHIDRQFSEISSLSTQLDFRKGYERAIKYNLAVELAPEYGRSVAPEIISIANNSLANIKRLNSKQPEMKVEPILTNQRNYFDIRTGS